ncbi:ABC transporter ATP-binding protein [Streptomyces shenzhenensis]|uniref:ABC transporter ATP-binding protein n=1 Tax=Streptomyces shenzhenensis TaxID=943815 RepID=UPI0033E5394E
MSSATPAEPLLDIAGLSVRFPLVQGHSREHGEQHIEALRDVTLTVRPGETVAVVGESGSGKSTLTRAILGILPDGAEVGAERLHYRGRDLLGMPEHEAARLRGSQMGLVPQDPLAGLDPLIRVGRQVTEAPLYHGLIRRGQRRASALDALEKAGLPRPAESARRYPVELSGGMRQRVQIAAAVATGPRLLIADEPTSALDVTVQRRVLDRLQSLVDEDGVALLLVTHDLALAAERADRVLVLYRGRLVEEGDSRQVLRDPRHEYTRRLVAAAARTGIRRPGGPIEPSDAATSPAPVFVIHVGPSHVEPGPPGPAAPTPAGLVAELEPAGPAQRAPGTSAQIELRDVTKAFRARDERGRRVRRKAVDALSVSVARGETLGVVGESGSGKTTLARTLLRLTRPDSGTILYAGQDVSRIRGTELRRYRRLIQPVFQDPSASLNPRFSVFDAIAEPLVIHRTGSAGERRDRVAALLEQVGLPAASIDRASGELSGGQKQRVAIARALAAGPETLVLDEVVSALDVLVQAQILDLLAGLQRELGLTYVFISHDLAVIRQIADHVLVMRDGRAVEYGPTDATFAAPEHPYTRQLLSAVPVADFAPDPSRT